MGYYTHYQLSWENAPAKFDLDEAIIHLSETESVTEPKLQERVEVSTSISIVPQPGLIRPYALVGGASGGHAAGTRMEMLALADAIKQHLDLSEEDKRYRMTQRQWRDVLCRQDAVKWYEFAKDMTRLSVAYPDTTFILDREGENRDDITKEYFRGGQHETVKAQIIFEPAWYGQ